MEVWDFYYATLCGWLMHPGYLREGTTRPTPLELAELADEIMEIRNGRMGSRRDRSSVTSL